MFSGSIVGQHYGVIQDSAVTVKTCNCFPYGVGLISYVVECLEFVADDLEAAKAANPDARGVINLSLGSSGCYGWYDTEFQRSM